jgi:glycolate oxidase FAD binding subunit
MTAGTHAVEEALGPDVRNEIPGVPAADRVVAPTSLEAAARTLRTASEHGLRVLLWGGGSHQGIGYPVAPDVVLSTARLNRVVDWQPEDLTIVVEAGLTVEKLEAMLADRGQSAVLPERPGAATVGGVVASGASGWRRLRYGPTRDRMLEVVLVTGDGRIATGGGRVVKNVTGYDIPRLAAGSLGALGLIGTVCLKLWPVARQSGTIPVEDAAQARRLAYRPLAVIETNTGANVYVAGTAEEVAGQAADLVSEAEEGLHWPEPLAYSWLLSVRVPAATLVDAVARIRSLLPAADYQAAHGVGTVAVGGDDLDVAALAELRVWAERAGGALVVERFPGAEAGIDPWGTPPPSAELQRRLKAAFDPAGICNPARLPGRI